MTMTEKYGKDVDAFSADLHYFASGGYLKEEEKPHWDEPFDPAAAEEVRAILSRYLTALDGLGEKTQPRKHHNEATDDAEGTEEALTVAREAVEELAALNREHGNAVIEDEEAREIEQLFRATLRDCGVEKETAAGFSLAEL